MGIQTEAKRKYDYLAGERKILFEKRKKSILKDNPEIAEVISEINRLWLDAIRSNEAPDKTDIKAALLIKKRDKLLKAKGYDARDIEYIPKCRECGDSGFVKGKMCSCLSQFVLDECYALSGIAQIIKRENFSLFDEKVFPDKPDKEGKIPRDMALKAKDICQRFAQEFDTVYTNLLIRGKTGTGKSYLTHCIAKAAIERGKTVLYVTSYGMIDSLTKTVMGEADDSFYENLISCDLLIIDDLGTERRTDFSENYLYKVVNERMNKLKPIVFSTNLTTREIKEVYDERVTSRIFSATKGVNTPDNDVRSMLKNTPIPE